MAAFSPDGGVEVGSVGDGGGVMVMVMVVISMVHGPWSWIKSTITALDDQQDTQVVAF